MELPSFLAVAAVTAVVDAVWAWWVLATAQRRPWLSALTAGLIMKLQAYVTTSYIHEPALQNAAVVGAVVGTYLAVRFGPLDKTRPID